MNPEIKQFVADVKQVGWSAKPFERALEIATERPGLYNRFGAGDAQAKLGLSSP